MIKLTPPYYAVIFTSIKNENIEGYSQMADKMLQLAEQQNGFLGFETASGEVNISVSYWVSLDAIANWKKNADHQEAQTKGRTNWYKTYRVRIAKVEREYGF